MAHSHTSQFDGAGILHSGTGNFVARDIYIGDKNNQLLADLRVTDPRHDKDRIEDTKGGLLRDSYRWILDHKDFKRWRDDPETLLLWIKGDPGKGKTMLLCGIINELDSVLPEPMKPAYFFCQATDLRLNNALSVLRGLIYMLVTQQPPLMSYLYEDYKSAGQALFEGPNAWFAMLRIFKRLLADESLKGKILIIDALDECENGLKRLLDYLSTLTVCHAKWIVSSRNWPSVEEALEKEVRKIRLCLELNKEALSDAVQSYIQEKVETLAHIKKYDMKMKETIRDYLMSNADDTFLWVALVCQGLADEKVRKRHTFFKLKEKFPRGLDAMYKRMVDLINESPDSNLYKELLAVVSMVYRPSTLKELAVLVESLEMYAEELETLKEIVYGCGSILSLRNDTVYFVHQSAKDYLLYQGPIQLSRIQHYHHVIATRSLNALHTVLQRDIYHLQDPGYSIDCVTPPHPDPLEPVRYSCIYWVDHLQASNSPTSLGYQDLEDEGIVHRFLKCEYLYWLEAISLLRRVPEAIIAIGKLKKLIEEASQKLRCFVEDAHRFILYFKTAIEIAPLQLYTSALFFSPSRSLVKNTFSSEWPRWIKSNQMVGELWPSCTQTLEGHGSEIFFLAFSIDGQQLISVEEDDVVKIWDRPTSSCIQTIQEVEQIRTAAILADSQAFVTACSNGTIQVWDINTGECINEHETGISANFTKRSMECEIECETECEIKQILFSINGQWLVLNSSSFIQVWNVTATQFNMTVEKKYPYFQNRFVALSPDGQLVAIVQADGSTEVFSSATGKCESLIRFNNFNYIKGIKISANGKLIVVFDDWSIIVRDIRTKDFEQVVPNDTQPNGIVAVSPKGDCIISGSINNTIRVYDLSTSNIGRLEGHNEEVYSLAFSQDGKMVASGSADSTIKLWDISSIEAEDPSQTTKWDSIMHSPLSFSVDGQLLASIENTIKVWDLSDGARLLRTLERHVGRVFRLAFSTNNHFLASMTFKSHYREKKHEYLFEIKIWEISKGICTRTIMRENTRRILSIALSENGQSAAIRFWGGEVRVWDKNSGNCILLIKNQDDLCSVTLSPEGKYISLGHNRGTVEVLNTDTGALIYAFGDHVDPFRHLLLGTFDIYWPVGISHDGQRVVLAVDTTFNITFQTKSTSRFSLPKTFPGSLPPSPLRSTDGILRVDGSWILYDNKKILWIPSEYRASHSEVEASGPTIAWVCASGQTCIIQFDESVF